MSDKIPIIIVCFDNYKYVDNTIKQIIRVNPELESDIIIMDNNSTDPDTVEYIKESPLKKILNRDNPGPWVDTNHNRKIFDLMPEKFILTDPDLQFNKNLPANFVEILASLSEQYEAYKVGFSLDISDLDKFLPSDNYYQDKNIKETEIGYWQNKIENQSELYYAPIDTTFALNNKKYLRNMKKHIRCAGDFTCKHLPWYIDDNINTHYERYKSYKQTRFSTISKIFNKYVQDNYGIITKNSDEFIIRKNTENYSFWINNYPTWEKETFQIFDKYLKKDKIFIDIGSWIGITCLYASRKSKNVYAVEADRSSIKELTQNCKDNSTNITIVNKAIFNESSKIVNFGKNKFLANSKGNDSTSHIYLEKDQDSYTVETITVSDLITENKINLQDVSLIKVDIEGSEEYILNDLFELKKNCDVPLYISFHYSWWKNKDLTIYPYLSPYVTKIKNEPFCSILF